MKEELVVCGGVTWAKLPTPLLRWIVAAATSGLCLGIAYVYTIRSYSYGIYKDFMNKESRRVLGSGKFSSDFLLFC